MSGSLARSALSLLAAAAAMAVGVSAAGAGSEATPPLRSGGTLVVGLAEDPDALDPTTARTFVGRIVFAHMCEKLYDLNARLQIVPQLAAALPQVSSDKLTYTIRIRSGVKFNDGTALNAQAVKDSLDRHLTMRGSVRASEISPIASVTDRAGMILSPKQVAALGDRFATNPVCVGPFEFKERVAGDRITLVKSDDYYARTKVRLNQIVFRIITDPGARAQSLRAGDIQVVDRIAATDVAAIEGDRNLKVLKATTIGYQGITLNIGNKNGLLKTYENTGTPLAKSQYLRTAFDLALDRNAINRVVFNGTNLPDCYPISPASPWYAKTTKGLECNLRGNQNLARQLVAASKVPTPIKVTLTIGTDSVAARLGQVIQSMVRPVGFDVELQPTEFVTALNRADAGRYEAFNVGWSGRVDPDGNIYGFVHSKGTLNNAGFVSPQLDLVLDNARKATTDKARETLYSAAMRIVHRQRPLIYLWHPVQRDGVSARVGGVEMYADGLIRAYFAGFTR
jgi:peptide/nickel transport system substrate-binding protein